VLPGARRAFGRQLEQFSGPLDLLLHLICEDDSTSRPAIAKNRTSSLAVITTWP